MAKKNRVTLVKGAAPRPRVTISAPRGPLFVGSWHRVAVRLNAGLNFDDLEFKVDGGAPGGIISPSKDATFSARRPHIMLCAGFRPGRYRIDATNRTTSAVVGSADFEVTSLWQKEQEGPSKWFTGITGSNTAGSAWGGGPAGPQNANVIPATGTRRIAILLVDTSSERYTADAATVQGFRDRWVDELFNGVDDGGVTRSAKQFYREASFNGFDITGEVFGPVSLSGTFDDYFNSDGSPKGTYYQACFTAGDGLINYNNFDTLLCVSQSVTGPPAKSAWPYASIGSWGPYTTADGDQIKGVISMPNEWGTMSSREAFETFCHELGHNLGMGDQYNPAVAGRNPGGWEMMHADDPFPHFSVAHRLMLGWVQPGWVQAFNFQSMAAPVDQTVTLSPAENGAPPAGRKAGIEIRLANGWNYYFEYRRSQAAQIADQNLPANDRVLGTDVVSPPWTPPIARPAILLLNNDGDGDGAVLANGTDYEETDTTDPVFPTDFKVDVSGIDGTKADVRIRYGVNSRPDPSIRPWPASPDRQWQSPDIEVRNARNMADPAWFNVPWIGNANTVIARVRNNGGLDAPAVRVNFFVKDYTVGGTPETFLGFDQRDIAAGATVEFQSSWMPPSSGHFCIVVRIPLYQLPANPAVVEMTELNNVAQSNYDRFISASSSPPSREITSLSVSNPYPERTRIFIVPSQSNPLYRTYLQHSWVYLDPGEVRRVQVMFEYAPDELTSDVFSPQLRQKYREFQRIPNRVAMAGFIEDPRDDPRHAIQVMGGVDAEIVTGRATQFARFDAEGRSVRGTIVTAGDNKPVTGGRVILRITTGDQDKSPFYQLVQLASGSFSAQLQSGGSRVKAYYLPPPNLGDCESETKKI